MDGNTVAFATKERQQLVQIAIERKTAIEYVGVPRMGDCCGTLRDWFLLVNPRRFSSIDLLDLSAWCGRWQYDKIFIRCADAKNLATRTQNPYVCVHREKRTGVF